MKKQLVVLSAAALVAAAAVPVLAFENEFHGMYRLRTNVTNFQEAGLSGFEGAQLTAATATAPATYVKKNGALFSDDDRTFTTFEQRARIQYIAKASDDLKLVTFFEIDSSWGDAAYQSGARGTGAGAGADSINIETKNVFLDFLVPSTPVRMKVGLQGWSDAYKGIIFNSDIAGAHAVAKLDAFTATGAFFRAYDEGGNTTLGKKNVDLYVLDGKFALNKDTTLGASYYMFYNDNTTRTTNSATQGNEIASTHTIGLNAATKLGIVGLDAFVLYQTGDALYDFQTVGANAGDTKDVSAWAAQIAANANLGMATVRGAFLYTSGDDNDRASSDETAAFQVVQENVNAAAPATWTGQGGNYYGSNMLLLFRSVMAMDSDQAVVTNLNNGNHGVMAGFLGADFKINDKFSIATNVGAAWNAEKLKVGALEEDEDYLGAEVNLNLNYKLYPNLTATLQGAYVMLGDVYEDRIITRNAAGAATGTEDVKDPYLAGLMLNYSF